MVSRPDANEWERKSRAHLLEPGGIAAWNLLLEKLATDAATRGLPFPQAIDGLSILASTEHGDRLLVLSACPLAQMRQLTAREKEIVRLALEEKSNKQIGRDLQLKTPTVSAHFQRIYRKLGVHTRLGLARVASSLDFQPRTPERTGKD